MKSKNGYSERYELALRIAAIAHRDQNRKGGDLPYITHPVQVSIILVRYGFPIEAAIAGLLHDVVEDQDYELAQIEKQFGAQVAEIVGILSERKRDRYGKKRPWETRKRESLDKMCQSSPEAVAVKVADVLHNARCFVLDFRQTGPGLWRHFSRGAEAQLAYYRKVLEVARERLGPHPLVNELGDALDDLASICDNNEP